MNKSRHRPITDDQKHELELLLKEVPTRTVTHMQWKTDEGREFVKAVRKLQLAGVSLPTIAEHLDVSHASIQSAVTYWERRVPARQSKARRRQPRPLGRPVAEATQDG